MAYLICKNLTLGYEGHAIVSNLNFKVQKGDYLCVVGENGTGKSTLIKTLLHLQEAVSGEVIIDDVNGIHFTIKYKNVWQKKK